MPVPRNLGTSKKDYCKGQNNFRGVILPFKHET
jgi:hypothetical protein